MQGQNIQLTRDNLIAFLDFAAEKGLLKKTTARARKIASQIILKILSETEAADLSKIDLENVILRHRNLAAGKISPTTIKAYESRVQIAVNDFIEYTQDPSSWKPGSKQRARIATPTAKKPRIRSLITESKEPKTEEYTFGQPPVHIDFQIHISPEATPEQIDQIFASMRRHLYGNRRDK